MTGCILGAPLDHHVQHPGAAAGRSESLGRRGQDTVRQVAAVAPTRDPNALGIGDAGVDQMVDARQNVHDLDIVFSPDQGHLEIIADGYTPAYGESFLVFEATEGITGFFETIDGHILADDLSLAVVSDGFRVDAIVALPGDANLDGFVDGLDFIVWNANKFTEEGDWLTADFNGDSFVDGLDFIIWNANKFTSVDMLPPSVPEPSTLLWPALLALAVVRRKNKKKQALSV